VSIARGTQRDYLSRLPTGQECVLAVEVSVGTLEDDRKKLPIYAAAGIPEVWILDAVGRRLERYAAPRNGQYTAQRVLVETESVDVPVVGEAWSVASFFD
jgi:Uma2 family endonuclease